MSPQSAWLLQEEIVPRLKSAIPHSISCIGSEDADELVQDATVLAIGLLNSVEKNGKKATAGNVAYYAIQHIKSGRRSTGTSSVDVYSSGTRLKGRTRLTSLDEPAAGPQETNEEVFLFHDVFSGDVEDPATRAARKLDWEDFCAGLPERERGMVHFLAQGKTFREFAQSVGFSDSAIQGSKRNVAVKILEFMGADILREVRRAPRWRKDLEAHRERLDCRYERRMA